MLLGGSLREKFEAIAAAGFREIELFHEDLAHAPPARVVAGMARDLGLSITSLLPLRDCTQAEAFLDTACELEVRLVVACSHTDPAAPAAHEVIAHELSILAGQAALRGLSAGYEALPWARHVRTVSQAIALVRLVGHDNLGLVLDSFHLAWNRHDIASLSTLSAHEIALVQICDARIDPAGDVCQQSRTRRTLPGEGELPLRALLDAVHSTGYRGSHSLEIFNPVLRQQPASLVAKQAWQSIELNFPA